MTKDPNARYGERVTINSRLDTAFSALADPTRRRILEMLLEDDMAVTDVAEPFETGYGHTIGNSLRRVLLSSLEGAAITSVKIDGAMHEFATIDGVVEDVTDIVLNLKQVAVRMNARDRAIFCHCPPDNSWPFLNHLPNCVS